MLRQEKEKREAAASVRERARQQDQEQVDTQSKVTLTVLTDVNYTILIRNFKTEDDGSRGKGHILPQQHARASSSKDHDAHRKFQV